MHLSMFETQKGKNFDFCYHHLKAEIGMPVARPTIPRAVQSDFSEEMK